MRELIVICGPTASGKRRWRWKSASRWVVKGFSADSMQIYRGMDIGTAKPTAEEKRGVAHHLLDIAKPSEAYSGRGLPGKGGCGHRGLLSRGKIPVVCGGTGLYIDALTRPMGFSARGDESVRRQLEAIASLEGGKERLHAMLREVDPESADRLHVNDVRRVVRALEIYTLTGRTFSEQRALDAGREGAYRGRLFGLFWPREELYERIDRRVDQMMAEGLAKEVARAPVRRRFCKRDRDAGHRLQGDCAGRSLEKCPMAEAGCSASKSGHRKLRQAAAHLVSAGTSASYGFSRGPQRRDISREILMRKEQS